MVDHPKQKVTTNGAATDGSNLIAIVAAGRNGSTLLRGLLDGADGAYVHPIEMNFLRLMNGMAKHGATSMRDWHLASHCSLKHLNAQIPLSTLKEHYWSSFDQMRSGYLDELIDPIALGMEPKKVLEARAFYSPREFAESYLEACAAWIGSSNRPVRIFKTIEVMHLDDYEKLWPGMRFIHIFRDPVINWDSFKRSRAGKGQPPWYVGGDNFTAFVHGRWKAHAAAVMRRRSDPRHYVVRYEDLIADPNKTISGICHWAGLGVPETCDIQTFAGGRRLRKLPKNPSNRQLDTPEDVRADLRQLGGYRPAVSDRETQYIRHVLAPFMAALGYDDKPQMQRGALIRAWLSSAARDSFQPASSLSARSILWVLRQRLRVTLHLLQVKNLQECA